jgi:hypothetical protein
MKNQKWTYNGIKRYYPNLTFSEWLGICKRRDHCRLDRRDVVSGVDPKSLKRY